MQSYDPSPYPKELVDPIEERKAKDEKGKN